MEFHKNAEVYGRLLCIIPWIHHFLPNWCGYNQIRDANDKFYKFVEDIVDAELKEYTESGEESALGHNIIYMYADQMRLAKEDLIGNSSYHREQLKVSLMDFLFAAITTLPSQTSFLIQQLILNPSVLARMQREIDEVVGRGRLPTLDDRINLHYTEACLREILRFETIAPNSIAHKTLRDCKIEGYEVPAGAFVIPTILAFHRDKTFWGPDVDQFKPERFLDTEGKLSLKLDKSLPFGAGKRLCAGETFARNMFFLLVTALFQNFNIQLPANETMDLELNYTGFIRFVQPFRLIVIPR